RAAVGPADPGRPRDARRLGRSAGRRPGHRPGGGLHFVLGLVDVAAARRPDPHPLDQRSGDRPQRGPARVVLLGVDGLPHRRRLDGLDQPVSDQRAGPAAGAGGPAGAAHRADGQSGTRAARSGLLALSRGARARAAHPAVPATSMSVPAAAARVRASGPVRIRGRMIAGSGTGTGAIASDSSLVAANAVAISRIRAVMLAKTISPITGPKAAPAGLDITFSM